MARKIKIKTTNKKSALGRAKRKENLFAYFLFESEKKHRCLHEYCIVCLEYTILYELS
jgi:hypothetical protein